LLEKVVSNADYGSRRLAEHLLFKLELMRRNLILKADLDSYGRLSVFKNEQRLPLLQLHEVMD